MKLTWFGATAMRIHLGGEVIVVDPERAPAWVDAGEIVSGADRRISLAVPDPALAAIDPAQWRPRKPRRPIEEEQAGDLPEIALHRLDPGAVLVDAPGEAPLVLIADPDGPRFGHWADGAVIVLFGADEAMIAAGTTLLDVARPRLLALAADAEALDAAIATVREHVDGVALSSMEPGLALEV